MTITDIKIRKIFPENAFRDGVMAILSITLDNCLAVHDIKVIQNESKRFIAMPSHRDIVYGFRDVVHPISKETRQSLEDIILKAYNEYIAVAEAQTQAEIHA
ncbi:MAG: SpoVG family protein [Ruminococcus sp.]|nr:SpoVG family protein [Ruminococcus sp.]MCM1478145.1 SpoVG family protein [Muribaculaceae bacterium]